MTRNLMAARAASGPSTSAAAGLALAALAAVAGPPALAGAHVSVEDAAGGAAGVSISTGADGALSVSASNGARAVSIDTGALGPGSGAARARPAIEGLDPLSVDAAGRGDDGRVPDPCDLAEAAAACD